MERNPIIKYKRRKGINHIVMKSPGIKRYIKGEEMTEPYSSNIHPTPKKEASRMKCGNGRPDSSDTLT